MLFEELAALDDPEPHVGALNMAIDEVLLRTAEQPILRCYRWANAATTFGYFGKYLEVCSHWPERQLVRRWTGGGEVSHGTDFTYSLIVPREHFFSALRPAESYHAIHAAIADVLAGVEQGVKLATAAAATASTVCFEKPVQHDLVSGDRKIAGAAQRRTQFGLLHQGSIQLSSIPEETGDLLAKAFASRVEVQSLTAHIIRAAEQLVRERYGTEAWLRRV